MMQPTFSISVRVYYEDTDTGGVVYYANYLKFFERARSEWLRSFGLQQDELAARLKVLFAVRAAKVDFLKPARLDEQLQVTAAVLHCGSASLTFAQKVFREATLLCQAQVKVACLDANTFTPCAIPGEIMAQLGLVQGKIA